MAGEVGGVVDAERRMSSCVLTGVSFAYSGYGLYYRSLEEFPVFPLRLPQAGPALPLADSWSSPGYRGNRKKIFYFCPGTRNTS
jgi:hypothetical protein